ncbi:serine protease [Actinophytocola xinjiangensis]|uniref:Serine protease n=1 Tax=Actinophytocola xinjiangensis TaxID=485602 RepID=A0A7Z0WP39_9PSEU|nr:S8 family peptidase [Actinophytocola xinjiangensis]OLF11219.1 serine protease [Actinophytocola xinjiangensis]
MMSVSLGTTAQAAVGQVLYAGSADAIEGSYVVVFKDSTMSTQSVEDQVATTAAKYGSEVDYTYTAALRGFAGTMSEQDAQRLAADPAVDYVQQNRTVTVLADQPNPPSWGLDRVDQRDLPLNNNYSYSNTAGNVTSYVIDTGIRTSHGDFGGRATWGTNTTGDGNNTDCNGHGTHVAGTIGGTAHGLAKDVKLIAVKVLNCAGSGSFAGVAAGIDWVTSHHTSGPATANMSLGASGSDAATENAVRNSIADGVTYALASGNSNSDACNFTPARVAEAITVNASTNTDARASFSNYGTCSDIFAPGQNITSAWNTSDSATNTISGTSMAAPHVAGAASLYLGANPSATPAQVQAALKSSGTPGKITSPGTGSPNTLLYTGAGGTDPDPPTGCEAATNGNNVTISDNATVNSPITISGCEGNGGASSTVSVQIVHTYIGDLVVDLVAPDGSVYNLHNRSGGSTDNINQTYTRNLSGEVANGTWNLRVRDAAYLDTGYINSWTLDL